MAITNLIPVFERVNKPDFKVISNVINAEKLHPRKFLIILMAVLMACVLSESLVSVWLTSDSFVLQDLKIERNLVTDERDALVKLASEKSSPENLAAAAAKLGMKPADSISYIDMSNQ